MNKDDIEVVTADELVDLKADCFLTVNGVKTLRRLQRELLDLQHVAPLPMLLTLMLKQLDKHLGLD